MLRLKATIQSLVAAQILVSGIAFASEKMNLETTTLVVEKLRSVLKTDLKDVARAPIQLRLADNLAERARLKAINEVETNCDNCQKSREDRTEALALYESAFENKNVSQAVDKGAVLMQMAHLNELLLKRDQAAAIYNQAIKAPKGKYSQATVASSYIGLADYHFQKGQFAKSKELYEKALKISARGMQGSILYRIAWCKLNLGEGPQATALLKKILNNPELLTRQTPQGAIFDASFQEDVSRDLATFIARGRVTQKEIAELKQLSPDAVEKNNVEYLATETDRVGNRKASLLAWAAYLELEPNREERLEAYARISRLYVESGSRDQAVASLNGLAKEFSSSSCSSQLCTTILENTRKLIGDWAKLEKKQASPQLLQGYLAYIKMKPADLEMIFWAAELAQKQKQYQNALSLYRDASTLAHSKLGKGKTEKERAANQSIFEASLLSEIEIAETLKNKSLRTSAYQHYLALNADGAKAWEVKYQLAYIDYESRKVTSAVHQFHSLALVKPCSNALCTKAADLSLDGLVQIKDEEKIETFALEYAKAYPSQSSSYLKIARTSVTNQIIRISKNPKLSNSEASQALTRLQAIPLTGATESDVAGNLKLQILLAEKANDLGQVISASGRLANLRGVNPADRSYAMGKLAWAYEMSFNFDKAYRTVNQFDISPQSLAPHSLRLAILADLAQMNPTRYEDQYLKLVPRGTDSTLLRAKKIRRARHAKAEFQKHLPYLQSEIAGQLALEIYAKTLDQKFAEKTLLRSHLRRTEAAQTFASLLLVNEIAKAQREIARHRLQSSSDAVLARSLQKRMQLLGSLDRLSIEATRLRDWSAETLSITALAQENQRLYNDIMTLPIPRKLKAAQREQYQAAVASKAAPFARNAQILNERSEQLWSQSSALETLTEGYKQTPQIYRQPLVARMKALLLVGSRSAKSQLNSALAEKSNRVDLSELAEARREAQRSPFSVSAMNRLKELEAKAGRETMVAYLDGRLSYLKQTGRM